MRLFVCLPALLILALSRGAAQDTPNAALAKACGNYEVSVADATQALQRGADPNLFLPDREEPVLHAVLWKGEPALVELLIKAGAKVNKEDPYGNTALHAAAGAYSRNDTAVLVRNLRTVLAAGADLHHTNHRGRNALVRAAGTDAALVQILLEAGLKVSPAAVEYAVDSHGMDCLELLLKAGGDLKAPLEGGRTLMHAACAKPWRDSSGEKEIQAMLGAGLAADAADEAGLTPLLTAAASGNRAAVQWLTAHGADIRAVDAAGRTALLAAAESNDEENNIFEPLIAAGCPLDTVSKAQVTALDTLLHRRWWHAAHLLLRRGARPGDAVSALRGVLEVFRDFPAPSAPMRGIIHHLLRRIPDAASLENLTAGGFPLLQQLVFMDELSLLKAALRHGVDINARDTRGRTALMWASLTESESAVRLLREAGADESLRDADGKSAADLAALFHQPPAAAPPPPPARPQAPPADLLDAVAAGDSAAAEKFLAADKSCLRQERSGLYPIHLAALNNDTAMTGLLIKHGANPVMKTAQGVSPFSYAAAAGHAAWCRWFIDRADAATRPGLLKEAGNAALKHSHSALAAELLRAGWKPEAATAQALLLLAVNANDLPLTREALTLCDGAFPRGDKDPGDPFGSGTNSVLECAARSAGPEIMELLLTITATPHAKDWRESVNEAFFTAMDRKDQRIFDLLLKTGLIRADASNGYKKTPLSMLVNQKRTAMVRALLDNGHRPEAGEGLLRLAAERGDSEIVRLLLKAGAPVDESDEKGITALHMAASMGDEESLQLLLTAGASLTEKTNDGQSAAELADEAGFPDLADDLKRRAAIK